MTDFIAPLSSLRTQGPIPWNLSVNLSWQTTFVPNKVLWLWVPAFAGTTVRGLRHD
jgi:hypothetical protein